MAGGTRARKRRWWAVFCPGADRCGAAAGLDEVTAVGWTLDNVVRIAVETKGRSLLPARASPQSRRVFFDLANSRPGSGGRAFSPFRRRPAVKQIRVAQTKPNVTRIVIDLARGGTECIQAGKSLTADDRAAAGGHGDASRSATPPPGLEAFHPGERSCGGASPKAAVPEVKPAQTPPRPCAGGAAELTRRSRRLFNRRQRGAAKKNTVASVP